MKISVTFFLCWFASHSLVKLTPVKSFTSKNVNTIYRNNCQDGRNSVLLRIPLHHLHSINLCNWLQMQSSSESQESLLSHAVSQLSSYICISDPLTCTTSNFLAAHSLIPIEPQSYTGTWGKLHYATHESLCDETVWKRSERHVLNDVNNYWKINYVVTIFMENTPSTGNIHSATQEIYHPLWNPKIRYCPDQWARWIQFTHHYHIFVRLILVLPSHLTLNLPRGLFL
jgi:hypothetical protein